MKSFASLAALAVIVSAQGDEPFDETKEMTEEDIASLFDNNEGGLIMPSPFAEEDENGGGTTGSAIVDTVANKEDVQDGIDWVKDLYNTLCVSMGELDDMHHDDMHHDDMNHDDMNHDDGSTPPLAGDDMAADGTTTTDPATPAPDMPVEEASTDEWEMDMDSSAEWIRIQRLHTTICDTLREGHSEMNKWNNADEAGRQEIEKKYSDEVVKFFEDFFEGAMGSFAVAGTALAASVAVLTF